MKYNEERMKVIIKKYICILIKTNLIISPSLQRSVLNRSHFHNLLNYCATVLQYCARLSQLGELFFCFKLFMPTLNAV